MSKKNKINIKLDNWQYILLVVGTVFILGPIIFDILKELIPALKDIEIDLSNIFSRTGMFVIGLILLAIVGVYELVDDFGSSDSKYINNIWPNLKTHRSGAILVFY